MLFRLLFILMVLSGCTYSETNDYDYDADDLLDLRVDSVLRLMTLTEKVGQMNQYNGFWDVTGPAPKEGGAAQKYESLRRGLAGAMLNVRGVENVRKVQQIAVEESRLGIPLLFGFDVIHGYQTISPIPLAESASWDTDAIRESARIAAAEAAASGINWTFAPMVDISRDARWGRVMEGAGEDPYLGSRVAEARVQGFQGEDLSDPLTLAACAKHFAGYGFAESGKDYNTVDIGTSTLYNIVLPPFKAAEEAGVRTFMNAFNVLNGVPSTGHEVLLRDILKDRWDFRGFVVSDWNSIGEMVRHGFVADGREAAFHAVRAGTDMDMESEFFVKHLEELVREGLLEERLIDDAVRRILRVKFELGLFDDPYRYCDIEREQLMVGRESHQEAALDIASKSIVLLKNEGDLLPLSKTGLSVALIGPLAADPNSPLGSWRLAAEDSTAVSVMEGLGAYTGNTLRYSQGVPLIENKPEFAFELQINETDRTGMAEARRLAQRSDVVVLVLGEHGYQSGEARSRAHLGLPGLQQELLETIYAVNKRVILVLMNGRPLALPWAAENIPAIVEAWHLGSQSGHAIARVLYGDVNPSGKLPMSFPRAVGQVPIYYNHRRTGRPEQKATGQVFWTHFIDESNDPLFPFGHGLSYTRFEYSQLQLSGTELEPGGQLEVSCNLRNAGAMEGTEVVQLYIRDPVAKVTRPVRELAGFQRVKLSPGEMKTIRFSLSSDDLGYYQNDGTWIVEPGEFFVYVGGSSLADLEAHFRLRN